MMTDKNQSVVWSGEFLPFGEEYSIIGTVTNNKRFPGQYADKETGLNQNWNRDYHPGSGTYRQRDPIGFEGGVNLYSYGNNPVNWIDPLGLDAIRIIYVGYPVDTGYRDIHLPLGHAAVITVDPCTGRTRYYEYGRYGGSYGRVMRRSVPDVEIGSDGKPTDASLKKYIIMYQGTMERAILCGQVIMQMQIIKK